MPTKRYKITLIDRHGWRKKFEFEGLSETLVIPGHDHGHETIFMRKGKTKTYHQVSPA